MKDTGKAVGFTYDEQNLNYKLVWSDEFDYTGAPDPKKWVYDVGGHGWGNNEMQYYTEGKNVKVENGRMIIEARREDVENREVTSTRIKTAGKGDWLYGKIEVSAKIPKGLGTWPAIWMLPTGWEYGGWPKSGEIDIMEHVGYDEDVIVTSIHSETYHHSIQTEKNASKLLKGATDGFHVYAVEWLPDKIKFFVDGELWFMYTPSDYSNEPATYKEWPFDKPFHLIINLAFGGFWGAAKGVDMDLFPITYEIDYVRVYQSEEINKLVGN